MKKKEKRMIEVLILILIVVVVIGIVMSINNKDKEEIREENVVQEENAVEEEFVSVLEDGTRLNISDKLHETKTFDGMEITNFQLTASDNVTLLLGTITNVSNETKGGYPIEIKIIDKEGNEIITVGGYIKELVAGESTQLNSSATFDYANAYDFTISKK